MDETEAAPAPEVVEVVPPVPPVPAETEAAPAAVEVAPKAAPVSFALALSEFCQRHSKRDNGVEILGGFHHFMTAAGKVFATEPEYLAEFEKFCAMPA